MPSLETPVAGPQQIKAEAGQQYAPWYCPMCTASCTFEAMEWCRLPSDMCPVIRGECAVLNVDGCDFEFTPKGIQ